MKGNGGPGVQTPEDKAVLQVVRAIEADVMALHYETAGHCVQCVVYTRTEAGFDTDHELWPCPTVRVVRRHKRLRGA